MRALLLLLALPAAAQTKWTVAGDTAAVLGQEARIEYRAETPAGGVLEPDALASATTDFVLLKVERRPSGDWEWRLLPLAPGRFQFTARWTLNGRPEASPPRTLAVSEPDLPADAELADIKPPARARPDPLPWAMAAAALVIGFLAWRRWTERARPRRRSAERADAPPEAEARDALRELLESGVWERGEHDAFYLRLTEIVRRYLERRYGAPATAMTSAEAARLLRAREPAPRAAALARELLERADLVKFARAAPAASDGRRDAGLTLDLIELTTPQDQAP